MPQPGGQATVVVQKTDGVSDGVDDTDDLAFADALRLEIIAVERGEDLVVPDEDAQWISPDARTCVLRVRAGEAQFDPDFLLDYRALTGSSVSDPWFNISGSQYFARSWDPAVPYPESSDDFYDDAALRPLVVDIESGTTRPYADLAGVKTIDGVTRQVDGTSYFQFSETGYVENGTADVVELHPDAVVPKFHLDGFLLGLERVR